MTKDKWVKSLSIFALIYAKIIDGLHLIGRAVVFFRLKRGDGKLEEGRVGGALEELVRRQIKDVDAMLRYFDERGRESLFWAPSLCGVSDKVLKMAIRGVEAMKGLSPRVDDLESDRDREVVRTNWKRLVDFESDVLRAELERRRSRRLMWLRWESWLLFAIGLGIGVALYFVLG